LTLDGEEVNYNTSLNGEANYSRKELGKIGMK